jgi:hypothetical protein
MEKKNRRIKARDKDDFLTKSRLPYALNQIKLSQ